MSRLTRLCYLLASVVLATTSAMAQGGMGAPGGRGPGGMGMGQERKVMEQFDKDGDKRLNSAERQQALATLGSQQGGMGGMGGRGGRGMIPAGPITPGQKLSPADVKTYAKESFFDMSVLRTIFLTFEDANWEKQLLAFNNTDIELAAEAMIDGKSYREIGVRTRGNTSFMGVPEGQKHSLNLTFDWVHDSQQVGGIRTLNLLNAHEDPSLLRAALYYQIARAYIPSLSANFVRLVINGESWGVYTSVEQFNKDFAKAKFNTTDGARWKVPGSPGGQGGLGYLGENPAVYQQTYQIKSKDDPKSWTALVNFTRILNQTPPEQLEAALAPVLDIEGALKFLALDVALVNNDGFWTRASDYSIYLDTKGKFHVLPADVNETFAMGGGPGGGPGGRGGRGGPPGQGGGPPGQGGGPPGGRGGPPGQMGGPPVGGPPNQAGGQPQFQGGGRGGPGGGGVTLDPLVGMGDLNKALRAKLLAVPALRAKYLGYVQDIATKWLDWQTLGPIVQKHHDLIAADTRADTRKLNSTEEFEQSVAGLKAFADQRRAFLLAWKAPN